MQEQNQKKKSFKETLNLPHTDFPIRPDHIKDDETLLRYWQSEDLYQKTFESNKGKAKFILHDGPPYANGHIHLGHAYNKILKDIVCKSERMAGKHVPVTPGWDCHGLPIERKVTSENPGMSVAETKEKCRKYANHWIDVQRDEFKKLGVLMNWDKPYLTMDFSYEANILRAFGIFVRDGFIEKKKKTVPWCTVDQTVLAAAEIEYKDRRDPSVYVLFPLESNAITKLLPECEGKQVGLLAWTTTPWTLPLNRALLIKPDTNYVVLEYQDKYLMVAQELADSICSLLSIEKKIVGQLSASILQEARAQHPLIPDFTVPIIAEDSVSVQDGTAVVHCAPGCGPDDYEVALKHNLEIFSPISSDGKYTKGIKPESLEGVAVSEGQWAVLRLLAERGLLIHKATLVHSYPHCWRCHNGLIFRATSQWFCNLATKNLKQKALQAIDAITFLPPRSINYLKATVEGRLEWCLSRQRIWGVPIPALLCKKCNEAYISLDLIEAVAKGVRQHGIEYWDAVSIEELGSDIACNNCSGKDFEKEHDILDVWFDSGISHYAVLQHNDQLGFPADMYLEGIDQHRGWFQSSLLTSMVLEDRACTKSFLTHGFTVDERGQKMSKSIGNVISPDEIVAELGTDGLRLWVSSIDYEGDAIVSTTLLKNVGEVYRKVRNTCRFLLSNLYDFNYDRDAVSYDQMKLLDRYALVKLLEFYIDMRRGYINRDFTAVFHGLADYSTAQLSSVYLDIIKDRLYVEKPDGVARRSAQTVCWLILDTLTKVMAPILSFTSELVSSHYQHNKEQSIHLQSFPDLSKFISYLIESKEPTVYSTTETNFLTIAHTLLADPLIVQYDAEWELLLSLRDALLKSIERQREVGLIKHPLEAQIILNIKSQETDKIDAIYASLQKVLKKHSITLADILKELLVVSQVTLAEVNDNLEETELPWLSAQVLHAVGTKCPRCWQWEVTTHPDGLCSRCAKLV